MHVDPTRSASALTRRAALAGLGAGALGLALASRRRAPFAQAATPALALCTRDHPLVGAWGIDSTDGNAPVNPEWAIFDPYGTWVHYTVAWIAIGAWRPTGERTAEGVEIYARFVAPLESLLDLSQPVPDPALEQPPIRFRFDAEVDAGGDRFAFAGVVVDEQGNDDPSLTGELTGVRLVAAAGAPATPAP